MAASMAFVAGAALGCVALLAFLAETGSEEARERNEEEANGYGPPRRPKRGYHGKRDLTPRED